MKQSVLDVLLYLFENHAEDGSTPPQRDSLQQELIDAGLPSKTVTRAFDWLEELHTQRPLSSAVQHPPSSVRVFHAEESQRIDAECQSLLYYLEGVGILDAERREIVIDRIMALDDPEIAIEEVKWIVLMVLFSQPGQEDAYAWMEALIFDQDAGLIH